MSFRDFDVVGDLAETVRKAGLTERGDVLALLRRRRANAQAIADRTPENDENWLLARDCARQLQVLIDDVTGGLHEGQAEVEAKLKEGPES